MFWGLGWLVSFGLGVSDLMLDWVFWKVGRVLKGVRAKDGSDLHACFMVRPPPPFFSPLLPPTVTAKTTNNNHYYAYITTSTI